MSKLVRRCVCVRGVQDREKERQNKGERETTRV